MKCACLFAHFIVLLTSNRIVQKPTELIFMKLGDSVYLLMLIAKTARHSIRPWGKTVFNAINLIQCIQV